METDSLSKKERLKQLSLIIEENLFCTDEELAKIFSVSIQTIRLDRLELGIPELRARIKKAAQDNYQKVKSLSGEELVGELIDLELEKAGLSILDITKEMTFKKTKVARGHHLFAQANSLAVALIDAEIALTGSARLSFKRPVYQNEKVVAKAVIQKKAGNKFDVIVISKVNQEEVLRAKLVVFAMNDKEAK